MQNRLDWHDYFLNIAKAVSLRSECFRHSVGAVIVSHNRYIKATGYNGSPSKVVSCLQRGYCYREVNNIKTRTRYETCSALHAEMNAIIQAGEEKCEDGEIYIYGVDFICILCKRFIIQSRLNNIYLKKDDDTPYIKITNENLIKELSNFSFENGDNGHN